MTSLILKWKNYPNPFLRKQENYQSNYCFFKPLALTVAIVPSIPFCLINSLN